LAVRDNAIHKQITDPQGPTLGCGVPKPHVSFRDDHLCPAELAEEWCRNRGIGEENVHHRDPSATDGAAQPPQLGERIEAEQFPDFADADWAWELQLPQPLRIAENGHGWLEGVRVQPAQQLEQL